VESSPPVPGLRSECCDAPVDHRDFYLCTNCYDISGCEVTRKGRSDRDEELKDRINRICNFAGDENIPVTIMDTVIVRNDLLDLIHSERERWGLEVLSLVEEALLGQGFVSIEYLEEIRERMKGGGEE